MTNKEVSWFNALLKENTEPPPKSLYGYTECFNRKERRKLMNQPTIKYRRRVTEDAINRGAEAVAKTCPWFDAAMCIRISKAVLEADADVIEVLNYEEYQSSVEPNKTMIQINHAIMSKEQFHSEWEERT